MVQESTYRTRLLKAAHAEFGNFWSAYRNYVTVVALFLSPAFIQTLRHGWRSMLTFDEGVTNGLIGLVVSLGGTYLIALWKGASSLDAGLRDEVKQKGLTIQGLTEKPKRTSAEEHHYAMAGAALQKLGPESKIVLRHLAIHGSLTFGFIDPPLPTGINAENTRVILNRCKDEQLVTVVPVQKPGGWDYIYQIASGMNAALQELLYQ